MAALQFLLIKGIEVPPSVAQTFDRVPRDPYIKGDYKFRCRAISRSRLDDGSCAWLETAPFMQTKEINSYLGDVVRHYPEVEDEVKRYMETLFTSGPIANLFHSRLGIAECHQIRITATEAAVGNPTPEGWHCDGYSYVGVLCVGRRNVSGGVSYIRSNQAPNKLIFEGILEPGDLVLMDDEAVQHYTSTIAPVLPGEAARDIFVLTFHVLPGAKLDQPARRELVDA